MNKDIPFGKENKARKAKYREFNEEYENALAYSDIFGDTKVHNTTKDNTKWAYNGEGSEYRYNKVRIPSIKRSNKIWRNFYTLFPEYYEILQKCLNGELKHIIIDECVCVKVVNYRSWYSENTYRLLKLKNIKM